MKKKLTLEQKLQASTHDYIGREKCGCVVALAADLAVSASQKKILNSSDKRGNL